MCCFGTRVFLLITSTFLSIFLHSIFVQIPVIVFYAFFANFISLVIFSLFFANKLPDFVKPNAVHYFSFIGGFISGLLVTLFNHKKASGNFVKIEIFITVFWLVLIFLIILNFSAISQFFAGFFNG